MLLTLLLFTIAWLTLPSQAPGELSISARDARLAATVQLPATGRAPFPAAVLVHGSGQVTRAHMASIANRLLEMGVAVLAYDKRGVGQSTGRYSNVGPANSVAMFGILAHDALAGVAALKARRDIDATRIGLAGISQAGWIIPLAASRSRDVRFQVILSGPAVSVGEEIAYSRLAGADPGSEQGVSDAEIDRRMAAFKGPHGYDPGPVLEALATPSIWIQGELDRSLPMPKTLATLERVRRLGRPVTVVVLPGADHGLMISATGRRPDFWPCVRAWLVGQGVVKSAAGAAAPLHLRCEPSA